MTDNSSTDNTSTDYNSQSFPPFTTPVDMNGVLNALALLALLAFTVKLAETATVNNNVSGVSGAGGAGAKTRSAATPASNNPGAELSANNPPRPGWTIKKALSKELPLHNGTYTDKASILDLYKTYEQLIKQENTLRYKQYGTHKYSLKGMTLSSFKSLFMFAKYLGLVKPVTMYGRNGKRITKIGVYGLYELTDKGIADNSSWDDLCGVWRKK
jgi:hypothetical protein